MSKQPLELFVLAMAMSAPALIDQTPEVSRYRELSPHDRQKLLKAAMKRERRAEKRRRLMGIKTETSDPFIE